VPKPTATPASKPAAGPGEPGPVDDLHDLLGNFGYDGTIRQMAADRGLRVDLHCDETDDPLSRHIEQLETWMDEWNGQLEALKSFILPGGDLAAAQLHVARTVCRRAERLVTTLAREEPVGGHVLAYLNRLSDFLFVAARQQAHLSGAGDVLWDSRAY